MSDFCPKHGDEIPLVCGLCVQEKLAERATERDQLQTEIDRLRIELTHCNITIQRLRDALDVMGVVVP